MSAPGSFGGRSIGEGRDVTFRVVPGALAALLVGLAAALPAAAQTPPPPPGTPISPPPTGVVLPTPPPTAPPPTEPPQVRPAPTTPPPTTATGSATPSPSPTPTTPPDRRPPVRPTPPPPGPLRPSPSPLPPPGRRPVPPTTPDAVGAGRRTTFVDTGVGLVAVDAPSPETPEAGAATPDDRAARTGTPPTQRRLGPDTSADGDEVAAPPTNGRATAATRRADRGLFRTELLPLLLLGGAVAAAYVACLQVAMRRREARAGPTPFD